MGKKKKAYKKPIYFKDGSLWKEKEKKNRLKISYELKRVMIGN